MKLLCFLFVFSGFQVEKSVSKEYYSPYEGELVLPKPVCWGEKSAKICQNSWKNVPL